MTLKKILIYLALVLPLCLSAQNYADYKLYASYDFEQGVIDRQANTSLELKMVPGLWKTLSVEKFFILVAISVNML